MDNRHNNSFRYVDKEISSRIKTPRSNTNLRRYASDRDMPKIEEKFICRFDSFDRHLYKDARILPCNNIACIDCIKKFTRADGILKCTLCTSEHQINNINYLQHSIDTILSMEKNKINISENLLRKYRALLDDLIVRHERREIQVNEYFSYMQERIRSRVVSVKSEIDNLYEKFLKELDALKMNTLNSFGLTKETFHKKTSDYINFASKMSENLNYQIHDDELFDANLIFECENKMAELKEFGSTIDSTLDGIGFEASYWQATPEIIGQLRPEPLNQEFREFFTQTKPKLANLEVLGIKNPHSLCVFDEHILAVTDTVKRNINFFDSKFTLLRSISSFERLGVKEFIRPTAIFADEIDQFYLYDQGAAKLYITDKYFSKLRRMLHDPNIEDLCYFNGVLFLLDRLNSSVRLYSRDGQFLKEYRVYSRILPQPLDLIQRQAAPSQQANNTLRRKSTITYSNSTLNASFIDPYAEYWLKNPVRIEISPKLNLIAIIDSYADVYIYDHEFRLNQIMNTYLTGNNRCCSFFDKYLFTHSEDNLINCFEYADIKGSKVDRLTIASSGYQFIPVNRLKINYLNFSWDMKIFANHLVMLAEDVGQRVLVVI